MERLKELLAETGKALKTLEDIFKEPQSIIVRDATIQRFEYSFEVFWKFVKTYLQEKEGLTCRSPKGCFREILAVGIVSEDEAERLLKMTDRRNLTAHTYKEENATYIYGEIEPDSKLMRKIFDKLSNRI